MASLKNILQDTISIDESHDLQVNSICIDSRLVKSGALFVAIVGTATNGHQYIGTAVDGCCCYPV